MKHKIALFIGIIATVLACNSPKNAPYLEDQFDQAMLYNDYITAIFYLHEIRTLDPENNSVYVRLADLYSKIGNYKGAIKAIDIALPKSNELQTKDLLFDKVRSHKGLQQRKEAIQILDTLCLLDKEREIEYRYEMAVLAFEDKDLAEATSRMNDLLRIPSAAQIRKELKSDLGVDNVSYYLAGLNFIGYIKIVSGDFAAAELIYQQILSQTQEFKLANNNIKLLEQEKARKAKAEAKE